MNGLNEDLRTYSRKLQRLLQLCQSRRENGCLCRASRVGGVPPAMKKRYKLRIFRTLRHPRSLPTLLDFHPSAAIFLTVRRVGIQFFLIGRERERHESKQFEVLADRSRSGSRRFGCYPSSERLGRSLLRLGLRLRLELWWLRLVRLWLRLRLRRLWLRLLRRMLRLLSRQRLVSRPVLPRLRLGLR
jgi:hypothetical protein